MYKKTSKENFYVVPAWVVHECELKYPQRDVYSIIYGWTQNKENWAEPTQGFIAELIGCTRKAVSDSIKALEEKGWLVKNFDKNTKYGNHCQYRAVLPKDHVMPVQDPCNSELQGGLVTEGDKGACNCELQGVVTEGDKGCYRELQGLVTESDKGCNAGLQGVVTEGYKYNNIDKYINNNININDYTHTDSEADEARNGNGSDAFSDVCDDLDITDLFSKLVEKYGKIKRLDGKQMRSRAFESFTRFITEAPYGLGFDDLMKAVEKRYEAECEKAARYRTNLCSWLEDEKYVTDLSELRAYRFLKEGGKKEGAGSVLGAGVSSAQEVETEVVSEMRSVDVAESYVCPKCGGAGRHITESLYRCGVCDKYFST